MLNWLFSFVIFSIRGFEPKVQSELLLELNKVLNLAFENIDLFKTRTINASMRMLLHWIEQAPSSRGGALRGRLLINFWHWQNRDMSNTYSSLPSSHASLPKKLWRRLFA
jgi:hypothetical protein